MTGPHDKERSLFFKLASVLMIFLTQTLKLRLKDDEKKGLSTYMYSLGNLAERNQEID